MFIYNISVILCVNLDNYDSRMFDLGLTCCEYFIFIWELKSVARKTMQPTLIANQWEANESLHFLTLHVCEC